MHGDVNIIPPLPIFFAVVTVGLASLVVLSRRKSGVWAELLAVLGAWAVIGLAFVQFDWPLVQATMAGAYWMTGALVAGAVLCR